MLRLALIPVVAALVLGGIWITGGVLTNNFRLSMLLTALWLGFAGLASLLVAWRRRSLALPVLGTFLVTAVGVGGYLVYKSSVDKVVDEQVAVAGPQAAPAGGGGDTTASAKNVALGDGRFTSGEHETMGTATLIRLGEGGTVLTLTEFETSPGPDLRVYLVTGSADDHGDVIDLGGLKGNKGNQQYEVPASVDPERHRTVVIWCRAFSVAFGSASLA
jgi:Electron transfer DM13